ncbi:MAG: LapA family protein [Nitrospirae bacterium]|nr:LapA family protein [Nitrospirota bacterium]
MITIIVVLIIIAIVAIFSVQNAMPVAISFMFWKFEASLAILVFLSMLAGIVITATIVFSGRVKKYLKKQE